MSNNSSTALKVRQPQDEQFSRYLAYVRATGQPVEDIANLGDWQDYAVDINAAALAGKVDTTLAALAKSNSRLAAILATLPDQAEQEEDQDTRTRKDQQGRRVFKTMSMDDIDDLPDPEYHVQGILLVAAVSLLFGDSNVGKTFLALHLALCTAYGLPFFGRKVKQGPVLYIYAEGIRGLKPRSQAWRKHYNQSKTNNIQFIGFPVHLIEDRQTLLDTIKSMEEEQGIKYALIMVDTFSNCAEGVNQNDQDAVYRVFKTAHEIVAEYGCHVMVVHHTNRNDKFSGSAAFKRHVDTMIEFKRTDKNSPIIMHCEKQREADEFKDISLDLQVVDLGINPTTLEPITSCVVVASSEPTAADRATEILEQERQQMLAILVEHKRISVNKWIAECKAVGISKAAYYQHIGYLKDNRLVIYQQPAKNGLAGFYELASSVEQASLETETDSK